MHYKIDSSGLRDAKEAVDEAKRQIEIANIQKEIDLLEDQKDLLNEQIDLLDERADEINDYYDNLISETEAFYDSQLKNLEKQRKETEAFFDAQVKGLEARKEKFQELTELLEKAELSAKLKQLGIDEEALLNGSEEEFNKLKEAYLNIVYELNKGNDDVLNALRDLSGYEGTAPTMLSDSNQELDDMNTKLGTSNTSVGNVNSSLDKTASTTSTVATNVGNISDNISESTGLVGEEQTAFSNLKTVIDEVIKAIEQKTKAVQEEQNAVGIAASDEMANFLLLKAKIEEVKGTLDIVNNTVATMNRRPIDNLTSAFQLLYNQIVLVSNELSVNAENSIASSIQALNDISLEEGIIAQFTNLKDAIDSVTAAISGGGGESSSGDGQGGSGSSKGGESGGKGSKGNGESSGGDSLTGAIEQMGETANTIIGEPDAEGDGTVIGEFGSMETAVNDVRDAIGTEGSEGQGGGSGGEGDDTLVGSIEYLGDKTEEEMGESGGDGIIGRFEEFRDVIGSADEHVKSISDGLDEIDGKEVSCTIKINIIRTESGGGGGAGASEGEAALLGSMNLESGTYNAKYTGNAHVSGTANVTGNWGVRKPGKTLVGELGQEIWVHSAEGTFETVGDNGPEWIRTKKNDLIFNHLQTRELLNKGNLIGRGKALAGGTALAKGSASDGSWIGENGHRYRDLQPGDDGYYLVKAFEPLVQKVLNGEEEIISNAVFEGQRRFEKWTHEITNNTAINNVANNIKNVQPIVNHINVTCPGVTEQQVAERIGSVLGKELDKQFNGFYNYVDQQSRIR